MNRLPRIAVAAALAFSAAPVLAAAPSGGCPGKDFKGFLAAFIDSRAVQRAHVADPLTSSTVDPNAEPEPAVVRRKVPAAAIVYPVMPGKAARDRGHLATRIRPLPDGDTEVTLAKPDTGYQLRYLFRRTGACWTLVEMSDDSL